MTRESILVFWDCPEKVIEQALCRVTGAEDLGQRREMQGERRGLEDWLKVGGPAGI